MNHRDLKITKSGQMTWKGVEISWSMNFKEGHASLTQLNSSEMKNFTHEIANDTIICRWKGHHIISDNFEVKVTWKNVDELLLGTIEWNGGNKEETIKEVCFPVATMSKPKGGVIFRAHGQGELLDIDGMASATPLLVGIYSSSMQYSAMISSAGSYYFDTRDTDFYFKACEYHAIENCSKIRYIGIHPLPLDGRSHLHYKSRYSSSIGFFHGGWFEAAQIYKKWAFRQKWASRLPINRRLRDIGMWVWNRGGAEDVIKPVEKLQNDSGVPVALDWYWWHQSAYDTSYPFYWPPREGVAAFKKSVARLNKQDIFTQVYLNGMTWDMDAEHWENGGSKSAIIDDNGKVKAVMFNVFAKKRLAWMCGHDNIPFRKIIGNTVKKLRKIGLSGVYLDMIGYVSNNACYNREHSHFPGGGNHQIRGYRKMLKDIIKANPELPLSTEEPSEAYMDLFDSNISLTGGCERLTGNTIVEPVPAFSAVYHGITAMFGNYALPDSRPPFDPKWPKCAVWKEEKEWHKLYPDQFFVEVARTVVWGLQPTVANLRYKHTVDDVFKEIYDFLICTSRFYHLHRDFLFDGTMMSPGILKTKKIKIDFLKRFIFTKEGGQTVLQKKMPAVLHSLWQARDGRLGLILVNYSRKNQSFEFENSIMTASGKIPSRSWMLCEKVAL